MGRTRAGLALLGLALVLPATASAKPKAVAADPPKVLVVTSTQDALTTAGVAAINAAGSGGVFTVTAPPPDTVGAEFTPTNLETYRAVVFLNTGVASPLTDSQRLVFEAYFRKGGGFVGIGSAIETDPSWSFLKSVLGTRSSSRTALQSGTVKVADRVHDASKSLPQYWDRTDHWYNLDTPVRGVSHVLATVVEDPFGPQPQGAVLDGIANGTNGSDHPVSFCKDYQGGRSFYTGLGNTPEAFDATLTTHLKGAINWAAGASDPVYSDCGATVSKNYQQTKIAAPPNINEPIGFDQLPDGRIFQTARLGTLRLHDPVSGTTKVIADFTDPSLPLTQRIYSNGEDGLYGPAVDADFATNKWVYLFYSPQTVQDVKLSDGTVVTQTTPTTNPPNTAASKTAWDPYVGYFQLSRFKFVEDASGPRLDMTSEEQIMRVTNNRQECCHVAGDIDFDKHGNMWLVTGDDTPAGGINAGGYGPFNDQLTDEQQTVRATNATGGTFTLTFNGQTTAPIAYNATAAQIDTALEALSNVGTDNIQTSGGPVNTANVNVFFRRALQQSDQAQITGNGTALTGTTPTLTTATTTIGGWYQRLTGDSRRSALNTNDLRGKVLRIKVKAGAIAAGDANKADYGSGTGAYTIPSGNLYPLVAGAPQTKTKAEVYAMGFRNPFRIQVDENDVAYISDYSPDANTQQRSRGPAGTGRFEIVRKPSNYGWPTCYKRDLGYYKWNFHEFAPGTTTAGTPLNTPAQLHECDGPTQRNDSRWNIEGGPSVEPGLVDVPPVTNPDIWYSYRDNNTASPLGTPCLGYYAPTAGPIAPGSTTECPRLFPELYTGGVGPHGMTKYNYDASNPNPKKFPPYYDESVLFGEWTQDTLREAKLDDQNRVFKINNFLHCGSRASAAAGTAASECDGPMDMQWGADGAFYLLTYGNGFNVVSADAGMYKWEYVKGKRPPKAVLTTDVTDGASPLTVSFSSAGSLDEDPGDSIRFEWDFGDGSAKSTEPNPTHTYTLRGRFTASLTVFDSSGEKTSTSTVITSGNTTPKVEVVAPLDGGLFSFGDDLQFKVVVTDPEDSTINCNDIQVTFVLGHDTHGHAAATTQGCTGFLPTDANDVSHGGNVFGVISAVYNDKGGAGGVPSLSSTGQIQVRQKRQEVEHVVTQSGTNTAANTDGGAGVHRGSLGNNDWIQLNGPFNLFQADSITFRVADVQPGTTGTPRTVGTPLAAIEIRQDSITGPILTTANLTSTGSTTAAAMWDSQTFALPQPSNGKHQLFLVFRSVANGSTGGNLFNLNWAEFIGNGVTVQSTSADGSAGATVPATLGLTLGTPGAFGAFTPGVTRTYNASTTANVISTAGEAALSVSDPSTNATGRLVNGAFALPTPVAVRATSPLGVGGAFAPVGGSATPTTVLTYNNPASNDAVSVSFQQAIASSDALRTGSYSKTLTFTLSTTTP